MREKRELPDVINNAIMLALANLHTAVVARVERVRDTTIDVKPVINRVVGDESVELPIFPKVPPVFMQGGGSYTAHPIAVGDYALLVMSERCYDYWYNGQDFREPLEYRMHDYSDAFAIVGVNPSSGAIAIPDVITQIGDTYQDGNYQRDGTLTQVGNMDITGNLVVNGNITCTGKITCATAEIGGVDFGGHVHDENDSGGPTDGPRNP